MSEHDAAKESPMDPQGMGFSMELGIHPQVDVDLKGAVDSITETLGRTAFVGDRLITFDKTFGFLGDDRFRTAYEKCAVTDEERGRAWRLHVLTWAGESAMALEGDFVECGVFEGFMSHTVIEYLGFAESDKTFYLYDTFEGFNDKYSSPEDFHKTPGFFHFAHEVYSKEGLHEAVTARFEPYPNVKVIKGVVPDILAEISPEKIAYLHVDMNSPRAERGALEVLFERVVPGAPIIFDDYGWDPSLHQKTAIDAFMSERGLSVLELPTGQGLVFKR